VDLVPTGAGILKTETMLRAAQGEINALRAQLNAANEAGERLMNAVIGASSYCNALVVQAGGSATITREEVQAAYEVSRRDDPATHAVTFTVKKIETEPPPLVAVQ
jgi:hypothetical protein